MSRRRKRHTPEQIIRKLRDADAMLAAGRRCGRADRLETATPACRFTGPIENEGVTLHASEGPPVLVAVRT